MIHFPVPIYISLKVVFFGSVLIIKYESCIIYRNSIKNSKIPGPTQENDLLGVHFVQDDLLKNTI